jgi:hypothetical protein
MGQLRRTIRGWRHEIEGHWGRLRTFHRVALGLVLGMAMIYIARAKVLDPMQAELTETHKGVDDKGIPQIVPVPAEDSEVQEAQLKLDNLRDSSAQWQQRMEAALAKRPQIDRTNRSEVLSEFELLIVNSRMILQNRAPYPPAVSSPAERTSKKRAKKTVKPVPPPAISDSPLEVWAHQYELIGSFQSVCTCLERIADFPYPAQVLGTEITLATTSTGQLVLQGREPLIRLRFRLEIHYHDR